jgi:prepilin-type N-terminal cleavage/methylation domain-containing protein
MFSKFRNRQKGFTLIELMIVVVIIGILAALAIPRFMAATVKAKESEAKTILKQIFTLERTSRQELGVYSANLAAIGFDVPTRSKYVYAIDAAAANTFTASATPDGNDADLTRTFTINQDGLIAP